MTRHIFLSLVSILLFSITVLAQDFEDLNNQANKEMLNNNYQKAIELSNQSINKKINIRAYIIRAICRVELKDYDASLDDLNSALTYYSDYYGSDNKEKARIYFYRGRCKQEKRRYNDAIDDFNTALSYNYTEAGYAYWNRGVCYYKLIKYKDADGDYIKAIERISDKEAQSSLYSNRGDCQAKLGNYETAYSLYARAITYNANNYNAYWLRAYYKDLDYKYEEALTDYNKAIEIITTLGGSAKNNDLAILYRNVAIMHQTLKQYDDAVLAINKSIGADPNNAKSYRTRADIYKSLKKYDNAKGDYENAITLQTDKKIKSDIYLDRSMMEWNILDYKSSLNDLNKAVEADPEDGMNHWHLSILYGHKKNFPLAFKECNTAMSLYKNDSSSTASLLWLRASHKDNAGDYKGAVEDFQTYLKYYPNSYSGYYELGRLFKLKMKNDDLADANLSKALEISDKEKDTVKSCYIKVVKGEIEDAIKKMLQVMRLTPVTDEYNYKWNLHSLACIYALAGNTAKALEYVDKSLKAGYDDYLHLVNDRDLISLMKLPQWKSILTKYNVQNPNTIEIKQDKQQEKNQSKQLSYSDLVNKADYEFDNQHYSKAKDLYERALKLNNGDTYAGNMIDRINHTIAGIKENNTEVKQQKKEEKQNQQALITKRLAEIKDSVAIELQYNNQIILADNLLAYAGKEHTTIALEEAIKAYKDALNIKPSDVYPAKQIKYINAEITNLLATKAKKDSIYERKLKDSIYQETIHEFYGLPNTENNYQKQLDLLNKILKMQKELGIPINRDLEQMADIRRGYLDRKKLK